jgi:hypothetical protein
LLVIGREHSQEELNKFEKEQNFNLPFYPDPKREIYSKYAGQNIPRNFIIDKSGKIVVSSVGFNEEEFQKYIKKNGRIAEKVRPEFIFQSESVHLLPKFPFHSPIAD